MTGNALLLFTIFHVALSLIGIGAGAIAILGFLARQQYRFWNNLFLWTTGITCFTGFLFPFHGMTPGIIIGVVCLLTIAVAVFARRSSKPSAYIAAACFAEALNVIVLIAQMFEKSLPCIPWHRPEKNLWLPSASFRLYFCLSFWHGSAFGGFPLRITKPEDGGDFGTRGSVRSERRSKKCRAQIASNWISLGEHSTKPRPRRRASPTSRSAVR